MNSIGIAAVRDFLRNVATESEIEILEQDIGELRWWRIFLGLQRENERKENKSGGAERMLHRQKAF